MSAFDLTARLKGKTALITGASSGIGASTAILFARCGASVILTARRADKLAETKEKCLAAQKQSGASQSDLVVMALEADMTSKSDIEGLLGKIGNRKIDILVNNAGMVRGREHVGDIADDDIDVMIQTNVVGLIRLTQIVVRHMKANGTPATIVNLGSVAGIEAYPGGSIYCATKHAVQAFSTSMMKELVNTEIRVCEIQPGMVETEFSIVRYRGDKARADNEYSGLQPLTGDDIAEEIVWCASRPDHVQIAKMLIFPTAQASAQISYRKPQ